MNINYSKPDTCLVLIYGHHNILPAAAAVKHYSSVKKRTHKPRVITVLYNPGMPNEKLEEVRPFLNRILVNLEWDPVIIIKKEEIPCSFEFKNDYVVKYAKKMRDFIGLDNVDELYYPHDLLCQIVKLCRYCYPNMKNITFGDGFGLLFDKKRLDFILERKLTIKDRIREKFNCLGKIFSIKKNNDDNIDIVAILPVDWSGCYVGYKKLYVVPKVTALEIIHNIWKSFSEIEEKCSIFLDEVKKPVYILILSNFADCNFISVDREIDFFEYLVRSAAKKGSSIIIKSHPLSIKTNVHQLCKRLESDYYVFEFPSEFNYFQIEMLLPFIEKCQIIGFSSSLISISYLFNKRVIYPIDNKTIECFFLKEKWYILKDTHRIYSCQLDCLSKWDQESLLWSGRG